MRRALAVLALAAATSACGSAQRRRPPPPPPAPAPAREDAALTALCRRAEAELRALPPAPYPDFDPEHPRPEQLPAVGDWYWRGALPAFRRLAASFDHLAPPPSKAAAYTRVRTDLTIYIPTFERQVQAARRVDVATYLSTVHTFDRLLPQFAFDGLALGNPTCDKLRPR